MALIVSENRIHTALKPQHVYLPNQFTNKKTMQHRMPAAGAKIFVFLVLYTNNLPLTECQMSATKVFQLSDQTVLK